MIELKLSMRGKRYWFLRENHLSYAPLFQRWNWKRLQDANGCVREGRRNGRNLRWIPYFPVDHQLTPSLPKAEARYKLKILCKDTVSDGSSRITAHCSSRRLLILPVRTVIFI